MNSLSLYLVMIIVAVAHACDDADVHCRWNDWKREHGRVYDSDAEDSKRFGFFVASIREVDRLNSEHIGATFELNDFADLSAAEFKHRYLNLDETALRAMPEVPAPTVPLVSRQSIPETWTSPDVTPVQNQGGCGSCWAFAAIGCVEAQYHLASKKTVRLSPQQIVDCDTKSGGCGGGWSDRALQLLITYSTKGGGSMLEADYPYTARDGTCKNDLTKGVVQLSSYYNVKFDESKMDSEVFTRGPMAVYLDASALGYYSSGVLRDSGCRYGVNHAVLLVGYGVDTDGTQYWKIKNSWGSGWGEKGFFRIVRGKGACLLTVNSATGAVVKYDNPDPNSESQQPVVISSSSAKCVPTNKCGTRKCGRIDDGCGQSVECGTCPAGQQCLADGSCVCQPSKDCGARVCGTIDNGCGAIVSCGSCETGQTCLADGTCKDQTVPSDWVEVPARTTPSYSVRPESNGAVTISTVGTLASERMLKWNSSASVVSATWTAFTSWVRSDGAGTIGMGLRMGQKRNAADGIWWRIVSPSSSATTASLSLVLTWYGKNYYYDVRRSIEWPTNAWNNLTVHFGTSGRYITTQLYVNKTAVLGNCYYMITTSSYPEKGAAFVVASGSSKYFGGPKIITRTAMKVSLAHCYSASEWQSQVAKLLGIPTSSVTDVQGMSPCAARRQDDVIQLFREFSFVLEDANETSGFGAINTMSAMQQSDALATRLQELVGQGSLESVGVSVNSLQVVDPVMLGAAIAISVPAAALSVAVIAAIAAGGAAAVAAVGGVAGFAIYAATRPEPTTPIPDDFQPRNPLRKTMYKIKVARGVDVMSNTPKGHQSISSRAPPLA